MLQGEHSAILSTFIKLQFVIKSFVLSILLRQALLYIGALKNRLTIYGLKCMTVLHVVHAVLYYNCRESKKTYETLKVAV